MRVPVQPIRQRDVGVEVERQVVPLGFSNTRYLKCDSYTPSGADRRQRVPIALSARLEPGKDLLAGARIPRAGVDLSRRRHLWRR